jgi:2-pyrone-4,6-dicarboxylate lactonase
MTSGTKSIPGATDVHAHVLDAGRPTVPGAAYVPAPGTGVDEYAEHLAAIGCTRGVLVSASVYGTDPTVLLEGLAAAPAERRGVAVVAPGVDDGELDRLMAAGVRGVRLQDLMPGGTPLEALEHLGRRLGERGGHLEIWTDLARHRDWLPAALARCAAPVVLDHLGLAEPALGPDLDTIIGLAADGHVWVTASGAYRRRPDLAPTAASRALTPVVHRLAEAVPDRLLWGSDWPFVGMAHHHPSPEEFRAEVDAWFPDADLRRAVLVDNPERLYGFPAA